MSGATYDAIVVGLGALGSSALFHVASRSRRVLGIDAFDPPHTLGSTHGRSRIIREAYYEHPSYVPLLRLAYARWSELEQRSGERLFLRTGGLMLGPPDSALVAGSLESARQESIRVDVLSRKEIVSRFPALSPAAEMIGVLEENAGVLFPEACVRTYLREAQQLGAEIRPNARVTAIESSGDSIRVHVGSEVFDSRRVLIAAGPWTPGALEMLRVHVPLEIERQTMHWFAPHAGNAHVTPDRLPVALIEYERDRMFYVMPDIGDGVKAAIHHEGAIVSPEFVDRSVGTSDTAPVTQLVDQYVPGASGAIRESAVCLYTDTPDRHFVLDALPSHPGIVVGSACSGHGFKFASALGEIAAQMLLGESLSGDVSLFALNRFDRG